VFAEQFHKCCFDELKQKLQKINIGSSNAATTLSSTVSKQQKEVCHEEVPTTKEEILSSITSDVVNNSDVTSRPKSFDSLGPTNAKKTLAKSSQSLPRIFYLTTNPSFDDQDGDLYKYVYVYTLLLSYSYTMHVYMYVYTCVHT